MTGVDELRGLGCASFAFLVLLLGEWGNMKLLLLLLLVLLWRRMFFGGRTLKDIHWNSEHSCECNSSFDNQCHIWTSPINYLTLQKLLFISWWPPAMLHHIVSHLPSSHLNLHVNQLKPNRTNFKGWKLHLFLDTLPCYIYTLIPQCN